MSGFMEGQNITAVWWENIPILQLSLLVAACCLVWFACNASIHYAYVLVQMRAVLVFFKERITTGSSEHWSLPWHWGRSSLPFCGARVILREQRQFALCEPDGQGPGPRTALLVK